MTEDQPVFVAAETSSKQLAASVRERFKTGAVSVSLRAMGPSAVNAAIKGVVELNKLIAGEGDYVTIVPAMVELMLTDRDGVAPVRRTYVVMRLYKLPLGER